MTTRKHKTREKGISDVLQISMVNGEVRAVHEHAATLATVAPAQTHYYDVNALVVAQFLEGKSPHRVTNPKDGSWDTLRAAMQNLYEDLRCFEDDETNRPIFEKNPPDLPAEMARARIDILEFHGRICDIPSLIELAEIEIARLGHRPVNVECFQEQSAASSWIETMGALSKSSIDHHKGEINRKLMQGYGDDALTSALLAQEFNELAWVDRNLEPVAKAFLNVALSDPKTGTDKALDAFDDDVPDLPDTPRY